MKFVYIFAILMLLAVLSTAQSDAPQQGLYIHITSKNSTAGAKVSPAMDPFLLACTYGVPKVESTPDDLNHWYSIITTPLQLNKTECNRNSVLLALQGNGQIKNYEFDKKWDFNACSVETESGPTINCAKEAKKCAGSILCNNTVTTTISIFIVTILAIVTIFA